MTTSVAAGGTKRIVVGIVVGLLVLALLVAAWFLLVPRIVPTLGAESLRREAEAVAAAVDGVGLEVIDDDKDYRVQFTIEAPAGPEFGDAMAALDAELERRGWWSLTTPPVVDLHFFAYRTKIVGGRIAYVEGAAGMGPPVTEDEMPETARGGVVFSFRPF